MKILNLKSFEKFGNYFFLIILFFGIKLASENAISQLKLPNGFEISIYASDIESPRQITETKEGFIIIGSKNGKNIYALNDLDKDGVAEKKILIAKDLQNPTGVVFFEDNLYFSEIDKIWIIKDIDDWLMSKNFNKLPKKEIFLDDLPSETWHGYKYIDFGPDGNLYIPVGVPCNICLEPQTKDKRFAAIHKFENGKLVTVASGVRNSVGFDWHPATNKLYFSDNGRDWLGDNSPSCELNVIEKDGSFFGYPYKHAKDVIDPEFGKLIPNVDMEFVDPIAELGPHVAPLGITFYDKNIFPEKYKNSLFVALHGSWNNITVSQAIK